MKNKKQRTLWYGFLLLNGFPVRKIKINKARFLPHLRIGGFHAMQVSLIITRVKNKIAYHSINRVKKWKYRRRVINKQRAKVSEILELFGKGYH